MASLTLGCNSKRMNRDEISNIVPPESTKSWVPVSHGEVINRAYDAAKIAGLEIGNESYGISKDAQKMFGVIEINNHDHLDDQVRLMMGIRNSTDKSLSAGVCFGSKVFVCDNLAFTAWTDKDGISASIITRKHTRFIERDLAIRLNEAIVRFGEVKSLQENLFSQLLDTKVDSRRASQVVIRSMDQDIIPTKDVRHVWDEWKFQAEGPQDEGQEARYHKEFAPRTAWSLFNAYTEIAKGYQDKNPIVAPTRTIALTDFFRREFVTG